jgi:hypothetical protein
MVALESVARVTGDVRYREWAIELARTAYARFAVRDPKGLPVGLRWKMSIDLRRPLVSSMGQHDSLDGYLVYNWIQARATSGPAQDLTDEIHRLSRLCVGRSWFTDDLLGIGGLLRDAHGLSRMMADGVLDKPVLLESLLESSLAGLDLAVQRRVLAAPIEYRLPFRELGLAIGLHAASQLRGQFDRAPHAFRDRVELRPLVEALQAHVGLASKIEQFWLEPVHRASSSWTGHLDINEVMLATSLAPYGVLEI